MNLAAHHLIGQSRVIGRGCQIMAPPVHGLARAHNADPAIGDPLRGVQINHRPARSERCPDRSLVDEFAGVGIPLLDLAAENIRLTLNERGIQDAVLVPRGRMHVAHVFEPRIEQVIIALGIIMPPHPDVEGLVLVVRIRFQIQDAHMVLVAHDRTFGLIGFGVGDEIPFLLFLVVPEGLDIEPLDDSPFADAQKHPWENSANGRHVEAPVGAGFDIFLQPIPITGGALEDGVLQRDHGKVIPKWQALARGEVQGAVNLEPGRLRRVNLRGSSAHIDHRDARGRPPMFGGGWRRRIAQLCLRVVLRSPAFGGRHRNDDHPAAGCLDFTRCFAKRRFRFGRGSHRSELIQRIHRFVRIRLGQGRQTAAG